MGDDADAGSLIRWAIMGATMLRWSQQRGSGNLDTFMYHARYEFGDVVEVAGWSGGRRMVSVYLFVCCVTVTDLERYVD